MLKPIRAIFPDDNPLSPKIIDCAADVSDDGIVNNWIFKPGTPFEDILFFLGFVSNEKCRMIVLGYDKD